MSGGTSTLRLPTAGGRLLTSGDEAGTAPGDRKFRPDVEGLRAVAIGLVVLYHANLSALSGGYVGVDVFFVISGFVITGLLLRETTATGRTSFTAFYARRSRRILPAATLVIVVTVVATYAALGAFFGNQTAIDARWTAVFLANFHFASIGTNYLTAQRPPSPLLNFWSLAVEEQFYLVFPALFATVAALRLRWSMRTRLATGLVVIIVLSFALSVAQTNSNPTVAYFSPFTRAWELALGALVAVGTEWLLRVPRRVGATATWIGLAAIAFSAVAFGAHTAYPGSLVAVPVVGAALVIAGGMTAPRRGAEVVLGRSPVRYVGKLSYSLYLWHWPMLVIAAEAAGKSSLDFGQSVPWLLAALGASVVTYSLVENPVRHARLLASRPSVALVSGVVLIVGALGVATIEYQVHSGPGYVRVDRLARLRRPPGRGGSDRRRRERRAGGPVHPLGAGRPHARPRNGLRRLGRSGSPVLPGERPGQHPGVHVRRPRRDPHHGALRRLPRRNVVRRVRRHRQMGALEAGDPREGLLPESTRCRTRIRPASGAPGASSARATSGIASRPSGSTESIRTWW